ncbi:MAG: hypothetical protein KA792_00720 [Bacteroidales bacterium]|nr:hypothetical protein [Bacteroidales bacterium]
MLALLYQISLTENCYLRVQLPDTSYAYTLGRIFKIGETGLLVSQENYPLYEDVQLGDPYPSPLTINETGQVSQLIQNSWVLIGQIQATAFQVPEELQPIGNNYFLPTFESGVPVTGTPGSVGPFQDVKVYYQSFFDVPKVYPYVVMKVKITDYKAILNLARTVVVAMTDNSLIYTDPAPALATLSAKIDLLQEIVNKVNQGFKNWIGERNETAAELYLLLQQEIIYVNKIGNGDIGILQLSGFSIVDPANPKPVPPQVIIKRIEQVNRADTVKIIIEKINQTPAIFNIQTTLTPNDESSWKLILSTHNSHKLLISNIVPDLKYWYRVAAANAQGQGPWSLAVPFISQR